MTDFMSFKKIKEKLIELVAIYNLYQSTLTYVVHKWFCCSYCFFVFIVVFVMLVFYIQIIFVRKLSTSSDYFESSSDQNTSSSSSSS